VAKASGALLLALTAVAVVTVARASYERGNEAGAPLQGAAAMRSAQERGIDIAGAIAAVSHRMEHQGSALVAEDRLYRAELRESGVSMTLRASTRREGRQVPPESERALTIHTPRFTRAGGPGTFEPQAWGAGGNRASRTLGPGLTERVTAREGKLEWRLVLGRRLASAGPLAVDARLGGARTVRLGELVVRDAHGFEVYRVQPRARGGKVTLRVPVRILRSAARPVTIDWVVSPEYPSSDPLYVPSQTQPQAPAVAFDGTNYLVVWEDDRADPHYGFYDTYADIYAMRVSHDGVLLDPHGIPIASSRESEHKPAVAFGGGNYLVMWTEGDYSARDIKGARVTPDGAVLDPAGIVISAAQGAQEQSAVTFDGANFVAVWEDGRGFPDDVYAAAIARRSQQSASYLTFACRSWDDPRTASRGASRSERIQLATLFLLSFRSRQLRDVARRSLVTTLRY
jgi:hypothetical protein